MLRRTTSVVGDRSCTFGFTVRWDNIGFYVSLEKNSGCPDHQYHHPSNNVLSVRTRLLDDDEKETLDHLAASCCTTGVGGSYIRSKLGRYMSKGKVAYMYNKAWKDRMRNDDNEAEEDTAAMSDYDHLTSYFESTQEIAYRATVHSNKASSGLLILQHPILCPSRSTFYANKPSDT